MINCKKRGVFFLFYFFLFYCSALTFGQVLVRFFFGFVFSIFGSACTLGNIDSFSNNNLLLHQYQYTRIY
ncbi:hypothetical protein DFH27DRAFT_563401 [Peziza echinospora]|nr:hypothetical protein DFH27DRAFT_563401 [Peziza echinospora]